MTRKLKPKAKRKLPAKTRRMRHPRDELGGKPIVDASEPLTLTIEPVDIRRADAMDPSNCGAARAIIRQEHVKAARVYRSVIFVEFRDHIERYKTPSRLRQETISFDRGTDAKFMPGDYCLLPPPESQRLGSEHYRKNIKTGGKDKRGAPPVQPEGTRGRAPVYYTVSRVK